MEHSQALAKIAPKLNGLQEDPNARMNYELMSDGLVWSDEVPPWDQLELGESHCLRGVWRFRTTLMLGKPDERFRASWEHLHALCPNWPGFLADRRKPDPARIKFFEERRTKLIEEWEALDAKFERARADTKMPAWKRTNLGKKRR
jgi:hypothetical protein